MKIRAFKLKESVSLFTSFNTSKAVQYVNLSRDGRLNGALDPMWVGWEFEQVAEGLSITPPWKGDHALVPWNQISFIQHSVEAKKVK